MTATAPSRFTAPTYNQSLSTGADWGNRTAAGDALFLQQWNRPPGSSITGTTPELDDKGKPTGNTVVHVVGPDGQPDSAVIDPKGTVTATGGFQHTPTKPDKGTAARVDSPAQTATAAAATKNADTTAANSTTTATNDAATRATAQQNADTGKQNADTSSATQQANASHDKATEANASRLADLQASAQAATASRDQAQIAYNNKVADIDAKYKAGTLSVDQMRAETEQAHQIASDAVAADTVANTKWRDEQTAQQNAANAAETARENQSQDAQRSANATETSRANQATEAGNAATLLQRDMSDKQAALDRGAATGAGLLQQRGTEATSILNGWNSAMAGNKNFGLGGPLPADFGQNLTQGSIQQATDSMGGQSTMDAAAAAVHAANPALTGTPQGAGYTALMSQMMDAQKQQQPMQAPQAQAQPMPGDLPTNNNAPAGQAGAISPSDRRFLGQVIGAAVAHFSAPQMGVGDLSNTGPTVRGPV